jgi:2-polyprenyl-3-methyl-5-hydroxy-6-metoxy-1,4-benzoquinol methylase
VLDERARTVLDERAWALSVLQHNVGFDTPEIWVDFAIRHGFQRVKAMAIERCPDCGGQPKQSLGQFVYYSTLVRLVECDACGLVWRNVRLDPGVLMQHFEGAYKDDEYFLQARRAIFEQLVGHIEAVAPHGGRVLDIGGAKGHLMHALIGRRPDLAVVVNDLSEAATRHAKEQFGLPTITGDVSALCRDGARYDVVVLSDVLYYEPDIAEMWSALPRLVARHGSILIRVPNKFHLLRANQWVRDLLRSPHQRATQANVAFFNPEHLLLLSRRYLMGRLQGLGFVNIQCLPSPLLRSTAVPNAVGQAVFQLARLANAVSAGRLVITPSMLLCARDAY